VYPEFWGKEEDTQPLGNSWKKLPNLHVTTVANAHHRVKLGQGDSFTLGKENHDILVTGPGKKMTTQDGNNHLWEFMGDTAGGWHYRRKR